MNEQTERLTFGQKNKDGKAWYKKKADLLCMDKTGTDRIRSIRGNYKLYAGEIDKRDFDYVTRSLGSEVGELPADLNNKDIVSGKIKALLGMKLKRPFTFRIFATNPEATSRREQEEFNKIKQYVIEAIMAPIRQEVEMQMMMQQQQMMSESGEDPQAQEQMQEQMAQLQEQAQEQIKAMTPEEVKRYMAREYQDPAEVLSTQLLKYLKEKIEIQEKFNKCFLHMLLSARSACYIGILNGEPEMWVVNPLRLNFDKNPDNDFIEDGEWASCDYFMTPTKLIQYFGDELSQKDIDMIYKSYSFGSYNSDIDLFDIYEKQEEGDFNNRFIKVTHCTWKALRKIGFLTYIDEQGAEQETIVDEAYKINEDAGDVKIEWEWIPEAYETWKIHSVEPIYCYMRPIPNQFKDIDNLYYCKLPYYGVVADSVNNNGVSLMDRLKTYQYYYNIIMYRIELLLASDKGKKVLMNINAIPTDQGVDVKEWQYMFEASSFMYFNPKEEGKDYNDINQVAKVIDLNLMSDIRKYLDLAEYIRVQAGRSVGVTEQVEGQIAPNEAVRNAQQTLIQSSHILEPYFELQGRFEKNVLQALIETTKVAYSINQPRKLVYILDDVSRETINVDPGLLDNSTLGIFVSDSSEVYETKQMIQQLAHAALQNQRIELSDVIRIIRTESIPEAEEVLKVAEETRVEREQQMQQQQMQHQQEMLQKQQEFEAQKHEYEKELIIIKEEEKRKTDIIKTSILGASFNPDTDRDSDGINDYLEIAKDGLEADIKASESTQKRIQSDFDMAIRERELAIKEREMALKEKAFASSQSQSDTGTPTKKRRRSTGGSTSKAAYQTKKKIGRFI